MKKILRLFCSDFVLRYTESCLRHRLLLLVWRKYKTMIESWVGRELRRSSSFSLSADPVSLKLPQVDENLFFL